MSDNDAGWREEQATIAALRERLREAESLIESLKDALAAHRNRGTSGLCPVCHVGQDQHVRGCWVGERRAAALAAALAAGVVRERTN